MWSILGVSTLQIDQRIHGGQAVSKNTTQFPPPLVPSADDFTERNGLTCEFSTDGAAQNLSLWKTRTSAMSLGSIRKVKL